MARPRLLKVPLGFAVHPKAGKRRGKNLQLDVLSWYPSLCFMLQNYISSQDHHTHSHCLSASSALSCIGPAKHTWGAQWNSSVAELLSPFAFSKVTLLSFHVCGHADVQCGWSTPGLKHLMPEDVCSCIAQEVSWYIDFLGKHISNVQL